MMPGSYLPRDQAARSARNRRHFFITAGVLAALVIARLVQRFFFGDF
jgi:hypothetical protein